jgi:hypothetical protein
VQENISQGSKTSTLGVEEHHTVAIDKSRSTIKPPGKYSYEDMVSYAPMPCHNSGDPTTCQEAVK